MGILKVPAALRTKLGPKATEGLIDLLESQRREQESATITVLKDNMELRIFASEEKTREAIRQSEERTHSEIKATEAELRQEIKATEGKLRHEIKTTEDKLRGEITTLREELHGESRSLRGEINDLRKETHAGFLGVQKQITHQTRWLVGIAALIATVLKTIDLFFF